MFDFIKKLAYLVTFVFVVYCGFQFGMPYYRYYAFKTDAADIIRYELRGQDEMGAIKAKMLERAEEIGVPISANHIKMYVTEKGYAAEIKWQETVDILGQYQKTLQFAVEVSQ